MKIIYGKDQAEELQDKYIVLELDTFTVNDDEITAYCVMSADEVALQQLPSMEHWKKFHADFIEGYKNQHWGFCRDCIINLRGRMGTEMDSYYTEVSKRIDDFIKTPPRMDWTHVIQK